MSNFCSDQGRTRVFGEAYSLYAAAGNPRRTQIRAKRAIYGWKLIKGKLRGFLYEIDVTFNREGILLDNMFRFD